MAQVLIGNWWVLALRGVFAIIFAITLVNWKFGSRTINE